jgi:hypothetical protein
MVKNKHNLENNPYSERLGFVQQFSAYGDLDDTNKSTIAHLAFDGGLKHADFYKLAHEIIHEKRAMGGTALNASSVERCAELPRSFDEARKMPGNSIEEVLGRLDTDISVNDPDDVEFYKTGVRRHIEELYAFSDKYRQRYGGGNQIKERMLADECSLLWIQHNSLKFLQEDGKNPNKYPTVRIYLNPRLRDSLDIYKKIFAKATREGLRFQAKIMAPSGYTKHLVDRVVDYCAGLAAGRLETRRDPIVFYGFEESKDKLLRIVEEVYSQYEGAFEGRETGAIPLAIAPGFAVGENPVGLDGEESLTDHRQRVIEEAGYDARKFRMNAASWNINPDNIAFNR